MFDIFRFRPTGHLALRVYDVDSLIEMWDGANLVLDQARKIHAHLAGGDVGGNSISQIGVGTSGALPLPGNTALVNAFSKSVTSVEYPEDGQVRYNFSILPGEAVGLSIAEFGLLTTSGLLYARKVRGNPIVKTNSMTLAGAWTIQF